MLQQMLRKYLGFDVNNSLKFTTEPRKVKESRNGAVFDYFIVII